MQPAIEAIEQREGQSVLWRRFTLSRFPFVWHAHPEIELTWITRGKGQRYVGDSVDPFAEGDLVLLGPWLPHTWCSDPVRRRSNPGVESVVVQFKPDALGNDFLQMPEMRMTRTMLERSHQGLRFVGPIAHRVGTLMREAPARSPAQRVISLLTALELLSRSRRVQPLASPAFVCAVRQRDRDRLDRVLTLLHHTAHEQLTLQRIARHAGLCPTAFARFFKRRTGSTLIEYMHKLRIARACKLLIETDQPVTDIAHRVGFGTMTQFNRVFRRIKHNSPLAFRKTYRQGPTL